MSKMSLKDFYQSEFNSSANEIMAAGGHEIASIADQAGIDWYANVNSVRLADGEDQATLFHTYTGCYPVTTQDVKRSKADIYSRIETKDGIRFPFINFVCKGEGNGLVWSGYDFLWRQYSDYLSRLQCAPKELSASEIKRREIQQQKKEAERAEQERKRKAQQAIDARNAARKLSEAKAYLDALHAAYAEGLPITDEHPYVKRKGIAGVSAHCTARLVDLTHNGKRELFMAFPLKQLAGKFAGQIVGYQKILLEAKNGNDKWNTTRTGEASYSGAAAIIGSTVGAKNVAVAEGFATAATVFMTGLYDLVFVALNAGNMAHVAQALAEMQCGYKITCVLDNDNKKPGVKNAGICAGLKIMQKRFRKSVKMVFPITDAGTDFNDLMLAEGLDAVREQMQAPKNHLVAPKDIEDTHLLMMQHSGRESDEKVLGHVINFVRASMYKAPSIKTIDELKAEIDGKLKATNVKSNIARKALIQAHLMYELKSFIATKNSQFSKEVTDPRKRGDHINYVEVNETKITDDVVKLVKELSKTGLVLFRGGMGCGKTQLLACPLLHKSRRGIAIANRVSLTRSMFEVMSRGCTTVHHYQDPPNDLPFTIEKLVICLNSMANKKWSSLIHNHDFIVLDEASQSLRGIFSSAMEKPTVVLESLIEAFARTDGCALMVDADANDLLIRLAELMMKRRNEMTDLTPWEKIHIVDLKTDVSYTDESGKKKKIKVWHTNENRLTEEIMAAAAAGEKILLATDSKMFGKKIMEKLMAKYPDMVGRFVSRDSKLDPEVEAIINDINTEAKKCDFLIYTPAIASGVSLEVKHFTRHFGMFCGVVSPNDVMQMVRRDRTAREIVIGIKDSDGKKETDPGKIKLAYLESAAMAGTEFAAKPYFVDLYSEVKAREADAHNDFRNNLLLLIEAGGYDLEALDADEEKDARGKEVQREMQQIVKKKEMEMHMATDTPDLGEWKEMKNIQRHDDLTELQRVKMVRWDIENELLIPVTEGSVELYQGGAMRHQRMLELAHMDPELAKEIDRQQAMSEFTYDFVCNGDRQVAIIIALNRKEAGEKFKAAYPGTRPKRVTARLLRDPTQRTYAYLHGKTLRRYAELTNINLETGEGYATREMQKKALKTIVKEVGIDVFNNVLRFGGYLGKAGVDKRPDVVFKDVFGSLGFTVKTGREGWKNGLPGERYLMLNPESFELVNGIRKARIDAGKSFYKVQATESVMPVIEPERNVEIEPVGDVQIAVNEVLKNTPISFEWAIRTFTESELKELSGMPKNLAFSTMADVLMAQKDCEVSKADAEEIKRLRAAPGVGLL